mgnify:FL=1
MFQFNSGVDSAAHKSVLLADEAVDVELEVGQLEPDKQPLISAHGSVGVTPPQNTSSSKKTNLPRDMRVSDRPNLVSHLDIDGSEFKVAVNVPRLGKDRILDSANLHGKLNDLLERGLILYPMARAAFQQAKQKRLGK